MSILIEFDIDQTIITQGTPPTYSTSQPLPGAVELVNKLYESGCIIIFNTARHWKYYDITYNQLKKFGFNFHSLIMGKINADIVIDDRSIDSINKLNYNSIREKVLKEIDKSRLEKKLLVLNKIKDKLGNENV